MPRLVGRVTYLSSKPHDYLSKRYFGMEEDLKLRVPYTRIGQFLISSVLDADSPPNPDIVPGGSVFVGFSCMPPLFVRRGAVLRFTCCAGDEDVIASPYPFLVIDRADEIMSYITYEDLEKLIKYDVNLSPWEEEALRQGFSVERLVDVFFSCIADPEIFEQRAAVVLGEERAEGLRKAMIRLGKQADISELCGILIDPRVGMDLPKVVAIYDFLKYRAGRRHTTVSQIVRNNPWVVAQVDGVEFYEADAVALVVGKPFDSPERVVGAAFHCLWENSRNGNAYMPFGTLYKLTTDALTARVRPIFDDGRWDADDENKAFKSAPPNVRDILTAEFKRERKWREEVKKAKKEGDSRKVPYPDDFLIRGEMVSNAWFCKSEIEDYLAKWQRANPNSAFAARKVGGKGSGAYLANSYFSELNAANNLVKFLNTTNRPVVEEHLMRVAREKAREDGVSLDRYQEDAIKKLVKAKLLVVAGSAGTGKSALMRVLGGALESLGLSVAELATTGAAAYRLAAKTGRDVSTVHRALAITPEFSDLAVDPYKAGIGQTISLGADVVMVDEATMLDLPVFSRLLGGLKDEQRLILFGDPCQLGAVGPGAPFADLLRLAEEEHSHPALLATTLRVPHRSQSVVLANAERIREGNWMLESQPDTPGRGGFQLLYTTPEKIVDKLESLLDHLHKEGVPQSDILVLCRKKGGRGDRQGTEALNLVLQRKYNAEGQSIVNVGESPLRVGDTVICVENDYRDKRERGIKERRDVFNGMLGVIKECWVEDVDGVPATTLEVDYAAGGGKVQRERYTLDEAYHYLRLAYSLTVHKAQGGEVPVVILVEYDQRVARMTRNLLYTAATRAAMNPAKPWAERVYFIGPKDFVKNAVMNPDSPRYSKFYWRVLQALVEEKVEDIG